MEKGNEFESIGEEDFSAEELEGNEMISAGASGERYDWTKAPEAAKAPPRMDLNGRTVVIKKAEIILPPAERPWERTRDGKKEFKFCSFILHYDVEGQQERIAGVRVFKRDVDGKEMYSHPTIPRDQGNQASRLLGAYARFKGKNINEISLREFMGFLNSSPKAVIRVEEVENPSTKLKINKNLIEKFVS